MHDVVIVGIPLVVILAGILFNRNDFNKLRDDLRSDIKEVRSEMKDVRSEMNEFRTEVRARFDIVDAELRYFHGFTGKLEGRVDAIEKRG